MSRVLFTLIITMSFAGSARADYMSMFLKSCAYGTLGGAALGLATLAISDNPGSRISNVARGASLGLYAGIGYGLYRVNNPPVSDSEYGNGPSMWLAPIVIQKNKIDGVQLHLTSISF